MPDTALPRLIVAGRPRRRTGSLAGPAAGTAQADAAAAIGRDWLAACARDPVAATQAVGGEFALAGQDQDGRAWLAVDRFASRSLCYRVVDGVLRYGERATDVAGPGAPIDLQALYDYLYFHAIPSPRTIFQGVQRLPPGHVLSHADGRTELRRHWALAFDEPRSASFTEQRARFLAAVETGVAQRIDAGAAACFLSGGTDSSTVTGMLSKLRPGQTTAYSIGFEADGYDEMAYAQLAAKHFGVQHRAYYVTPADLARHVPAVAAHYDQPFGNSSALPAYCCARLAHEDGFGRILAGDGGDELYGGNERYATQRIFGYYDEVPPVVRRGLLEPLLLGTPLGRLPLLKKGASYIRQAQVPLPGRMHTYNLLQRVGHEAMFERDFLAAIDLADTARQQDSVWAEPSRAGTLNRMLAYDWRYTLAENDLPKVVQTTGLAGLSVGFPMLDDGVTDLSMGLPDSFKLKGLKLRWFFKEALRGFLPDEILTKPKHGFGLPFGVWLARDEGLNGLASDALGSLAERGIVRPDFSRTLIGSKLPEHPAYWGELVWILMMLEHWLRAHAPRFHAQRHPYAGA